MTITVHKDGNGYLAEIIEHPSVYAFGDSEKEAISELSCVIEMLGESFVFASHTDKEIFSA